MANWRLPPELGLTPVKEPTVEGLPEALTLLPFVSKHGAIRHAFRGESNGIPRALFEHARLVNAIQASFQITHAVWATMLDLPWPLVRVRPRRWYTPSPRDRILLENDQFNRRFIVTSRDPDFALLLLTPEMQAFLAERGPKESWYVIGGALVVARRGKLRKRMVVEGFEALETFQQLIPPELEAWGLVD